MFGDKSNVCMFQIISKLIRKQTGLQFSMIEHQMKFHSNVYCVFQKKTCVLCVKT
jgi:uncharacterized protein YhbP (UPF0306 family)